MSYVFWNILFKQAITHVQNVYQELEGSDSISSELPSYSFSIDSGDEIVIKNAPEPFIIQIKNKPEDLASANISLRMPGDYYPYSIQLDSPDCALVLSLAALNDHRNETNLTVLIQYGKTPSSDDFDLKLILTDQGLLEISAGNYTTITSPAGGDWNLTGNNVYVRESNDNSVLIWNFVNHRYANFTNKSQLNFGFFYDGPMPELVVVEDIYRFDKLEYAGRFNYSLRTFCAKCTYADLQTNTWSQEGCEVSFFGRKRFFFETFLKIR